MPIYVTLSQHLTMLYHLNGGIPTFCGV